MDKEIELRIQNLIQLRTNLYTAVVILVGGIFGLSLSIFNSNSNIYELFFKIISLILGMLFVTSLFSSLRSIANELNGYLYSKENKK